MPDSNEDALSQQVQDMYLRVVNERERRVSSVNWTDLLTAPTITVEEPDACDCGACRTARRNQRAPRPPLPGPVEGPEMDWEQPPDGLTVHEAQSERCSRHNTRHYWDTWARQADNGSPEGAWANGYPDYGYCHFVPPPTECTCWDCLHGSCDIDPCDACVMQREEDERRERRRNLIRNYSYRPNPFRFFGEGPAYLGVELEICDNGNRWDAAEAAQDILGRHGYLKDDSTVPGFEIVTMPHDYGAHVEEMPWGTLLNTLCGDFDMYDGEEAGMHIHIARTAFTGPAHAMRWQRWFYSARRLVREIARRDSDEWAAWPGRESRKAATKAVAKTIDKVGQRRRDDYGDMYTPDAYSLLQAEGYYPERYQAINPSNNDTLEVRVFASTTDPDDVYASIGLLDASIQYTKNLTVRDIVQDRALSRPAFRAWVNGNGAYPALASRL